MEYFLTQIQVLLPVLGYSFGLPTPSAETAKAASVEINQQVTQPTFYMNLHGTYAEAQEINGEFVVFKNATARKKSVDSLEQTAYVGLRKQLINDKKLVDNGGEFLVFQEDIAFSSPSAAATTISGSSVNGRTTWKVKGREITYKDWLEEQISAVSESTASDS